ncbi:alpha/beta fold hydrolase [Salinarimonas ramus]|uniref:Lysophospholipase n=1 Tax=Salinarimonas ramus TaxID=690164 RepID=A0A917Q4U3_9HYPH|nr:alpha/beta hydrolase [Salinarimonas ramus]GGK26519.1 lysophospholipase [Salinarimonas ramus]
MKLVPTPGNPIPEGAIVGRIVARDGAPLRVARWPARCPSPRGTVVIFQGRAEFIEKYFETIRDLLARDFAVVAFDWRGQGGSERVLSDPRKGHVGRFGRYARDVEAIAAQVLARDCPGPHAVLGHSMGAAIALDLARRGRLPAERIVALAPMIGLAQVTRPRLAHAATTLAWLAGFGGAWIPGGGETSMATKPFATNLLTSDRLRYARNADAAAALKDGAIGDPTIGWARGAFALMRRLQEPRAALEIRIPTLVIAAGADRVVSTPAVERFAARLKTGNALVVPGARHELLTEVDAIRAPVLAAIDAFLPGADAAEADDDGDLALYRQSG